MEVPAHHWSHVRLQCHRARPFVLPELGQHLARERNLPRCEAPATQNPIPYLQLVHGVDVAVEEADRQGLHVLTLDVFEHRVECVQIERCQDTPLVVQALWNLVAPPPRDERIGKPWLESVELGPMLAPDGQDVPESLGGDQRGAGTLPLQHRIRGHR